MKTVEHSARHKVIQSTLITIIMNRDPDRSFSDLFHLGKLKYIISWFHFEFSLSQTGSFKNNL